MSTPITVNGRQFCERCQRPYASTTSGNRHLCNAHVVTVRVDAAPVVPDPVPREPDYGATNFCRECVATVRRDDVRAAFLALAIIGFAFQRIADNDTTHRAIKRANWGWARTESKKLAEAILCALHDDVDEAIGGTPELPEEGA